MRSSIKDISTGILLIGFSVFMYLIANSFGRSQTETLYGPDFFPKLVLILLIAFSIVLCIKGFLSLKGESTKWEIDRKLIFQILLYIILLVIYINLFFIIGFVYSTIVFLLIGQYLFGLRKWIRLILVAIIVPFVLYYLFTNLFNIPLP
ncbi:tripartite tricarboxylate transporter TctB family protein [Virgibacillus halodenitrificans]|uniref:tripartite tricarboxylate transporter TctB family protein n=1 Tax=Virgibacillus halodenitrificans TaxID=1482 RepID=UPI000361ADA3